MSKNSKKKKIPKFHKFKFTNFLLERKVETCLKHHCAYPNVTAGATRGSVRNHACAIVPTVLLRALIIKAQSCRRAHIISNDNSFIHDVPRGHAQQGWRHGGIGTETCHGEEIHTCLPLPIDRRGDARLGTKSLVRNSTDGASSCIDYQSTIVPTGAHNFKRQHVHTRRAPRACAARLAARRRRHRNVSR